MSDSENEVFLRDAEAQNDQDDQENVVNDGDEQLAGAVGGNDLLENFMSIVMRMSKPNRPQKDFPLYNGSECWDDYFQQVLRVRALNGWSDQEAANLLSLSMKGPALEIVNAVQRAKRGTPLSWTELVETLKNTFSPVEDTYSLRSLLRNRKQSTYESILQLHMSLRSDISKAYPHLPLSEQDRLGVEIFTEALSDSDIRLAVLRSKPQTMSEALKCAEGERILLEAARRQSVLPSSQSGYSVDLAPTSVPKLDQKLTRNQQNKFPYHKSNTEEVNELKQQLAELTSRLSELETGASNMNLNNAGDSGHNKAYQYRAQGRGRGNYHKGNRGKCWTCGGTGHYQNKCPLN